MPFNTLREIEMDREEYDKMVKKYVDDTDPEGKCPKCNSKKIGVSSDAAFISNKEIGLNAWCSDCKTTWMEYYRLYDIELRGDDGSLIDRGDLPEK